MIPILIVDDHIIFVEALEMVLSGVDGFQIVGKAANGQEAVDLIRKQPEIKVAILDIMMPVLNGIDATKLIKQEFPRVKVLILSAHQQIQYIKQSQEAGADGYLLKNCGTEELIHAIRELANDEIYFSQEIMAIEKKYERSRASKIPLTWREKEVLKLIAQGYSSHQIASHLQVSASTVLSHRKNLMIKLEARNMVGAIRHASERGYLNPDFAGSLIDRNNQPEPILSPREKEVWDLVSEGFTSNQIAEKLGIARSTIDVHRKNIKKKLG